MSGGEKRAKKKEKTPSTLFLTDHEIEQASIWAERQSRRKTQDNGFDLGS
jgi:hypothetical protein